MRGTDKGTAGGTAGWPAVPLTNYPHFVISILFFYVINIKYNKTYFTFYI